MSDVLCVTDETTDNPLVAAYEYLNCNFDCQLITNEVDLLALKPKIIVTNCLKPLSLSKNVKIIYYACSCDGSPFLSTDINIRRQLQLRPEIDMFCSSVYLAKLIYLNYKIKAKVQYPFIKSVDLKTEPMDIVYNTPTSSIESLKDELPSETFKVYNGDLTFAKLYIHIPNCEEATNTRIQTASAFGVPVITLSCGCIPELINAGDTLFTKETNLKQWTQGVKMAIRDHDKNSDHTRNASKKWSNLDALADKVKKQAQQRALQKIGHMPDIKHNILADRAVLAHQKRARTRISTPPQEPIRNVVTHSREPYIPPQVSEMPMSVNAEVSDVSVIIPMFRSCEVIDKQIQSWDLTHKEEIIYVNDCCPDNSADSVVRSWSTRNNVANVRLLSLSNNSGFATACNVGAQHARGKFLIFLNADTTVTANWIKNLIEPLQDDRIGIVGNLQLKYDGIIDSAGSEWMWDSRSFEHIGRNVYHGKRLTKMMTLNEAPADLLHPGERDMVTGCCFAIRKSLFDEIGGFDINYRIGYWEDANLNMEVKERGYKIWFQPSSVIYHKTGHSRACLHPFIMDNVRLFYSKWVDTGRIDSLVGAKRP